MFPVGLDADGREAFTVFADTHALRVGDHVAVGGDMILGDHDAGADAMVALRVDHVNLDDGRLEVVDQAIGRLRVDM